MLYHGRSLVAAALLVCAAALAPGPTGAAGRPVAAGGRVVGPGPAFGQPAALARDTRVGVSLSALEPGAGGGVVFVDAMKQAAPWSSARPLALDGAGNVARLAPGQSAETAVYVGEPYPGGDYVLLYDGKGRIEIDPRSGAVVAERRGRMTVRVTPDWSYGIRLRLSATDPADHLRNLRLILPGFEQSYAAQPFHPLFLRALGPFALLRFERWMHAGTPSALAWDRRTTPRSATQARAEGVAPEYLVALANATGADPWFAFPAGADDDYVARFAALVAAQLDPRLTPVFECGSEVWRTGTPANAAAFASGLLNRGPRGAQSPALGWYAARSARVAALVRQAFAASGRRPQIVVSGPLALPGTDGEALDRAILAAAAGVADAFAVSAASGADTAANGGNLAGTSTFADGVATSARLARAARLPLIAYEADPLGVAHLALPPPLAAQYLARARSAQTGALYANALETWHGAGGGLVVTEPLVQAAYAAPTGGLLERVDQDPLTAPKYRGVLSYVARHPVPRVVPAPQPPGGVSAPSGAAAPSAGAAALAANVLRKAGRTRAVPPRRPAPASGAPRRLRAAVAPNSYVQAILADGPLALYQLDDSGSVAADSSPNGFDGSVGTGVGEGAPGLLTCCSAAKAMLFPGTTATAGTVLVPRSTAFEPSASVSMEALLRFSAAPADYSVPLGYGSDSSYAPYDLYFTRSGQLNAQFNLTGGPLVATMAGALQPNVTYHVAATYDGATARLYVNGSQVASAARAGTLAGYDPQHGFAIGDDAGFSDPGFGGTLSDVAVYAKTLGAAQVQAHYQASRTVAMPAPTPTPAPASYVSSVLASGPAAYYRLNDAGPKAADSAPNHLDGTSGASVHGGAPSLLATTADPATSYPGSASASGVTLVPPSALLRPSGAVTMECFLQFASVPAAWTVPLAYGSDVNYAPYDLYFTRSGTLNAQFTLTSGVLVVSDPAPLRANTPYHVVATYDGAVGRLYVNGAQVASAAQSGALSDYDTTHGLAIGDDAGYSDPPFAGTIEQVAIYAKALSAADVANHYTAASGLPPQALVDWPTFHADTLRTGWNSHESQLTAWQRQPGRLRPARLARGRRPGLRRTAGRGERDRARDRHAEPADRRDRQRHRLRLRGRHRRAGLDAQLHRCGRDRGALDRHRLRQRRADHRHHLDPGDRPRARHALRRRGDRRDGRHDHHHAHPPARPLAPERGRQARAGRHRRERSAKRRRHDSLPAAVADEPGQPARSERRDLRRVRQPLRLRRAARARVAVRLRRGHARAVRLDLQHHHRPDQRRT